MWWAAVATISGNVAADPGVHQLDPRVFHVAGMILHAASTGIVLVLLRRVCGDPRAALLGALMFAVHPVQVESVGWISGQKDLLAWTLGFASLVFWTSAKTSDPPDGKVWRLMASRGYVVSFLLLVLALLAKPATMVIPLMAYLLDRRSNRRGVLESGVLFAPMFIASAIAAIVARTVQTTPEVESISYALRPLVALDALAFYTLKVLAPLQLAIDYSRTPEFVLESGKVWLTWMVPVAIGGFAFATRKRFPVASVGFLLAVVAILPMLGLTPFQFQLYSTTADHYLYGSMLGLSCVFASIVARSDTVVVKIPSSPTTATSLGVDRIRLPVAYIMIAIWSGLSFVQCGVWRSDFTLFQHAVDINPRSFAGHNNLGSALMTAGRADLAVEALRRGAQFNPRLYASSRNLGFALAAVGNVVEARKWFDVSVDTLRDSTKFTDRNLAGLYIEACRAMIKAGSLDDADHFQKLAQALYPNEQAVKNLRIAIDQSRAATRPSVSK